MALGHGPEALGDLLPDNPQVLRRSPPTPRKGTNGVIPNSQCNAMENQVLFDPPRSTAPSSVELTALIVENDRESQDAQGRLYHLSCAVGRRKAKSVVLPVVGATTRCCVLRETPVGTHRKTLFAEAARGPSVVPSESSKSETFPITIRSISTFQRALLSASGCWKALTSNFWLQGASLRSISRARGFVSGWPSPSLPRFLPRGP